MLAGSVIALRAGVAELPPFQEIFDLIRTNAGGLSQPELNAAAVEGLLSKLGSRARLVDPSQAKTPDSNVAPISSTGIFDEHYGYVRIARVGPKLPEEFALVLAKLTATNKLSGMVIDLRYANGNDYAAAVKVADAFLGSEQPLLDWGHGIAKSTDKTNAFRLPVAVLINHFTMGAAEALGAVLRHADVGLLIGTNTAGLASIARDFPLSNQDVLRVAVSPVKLGDGEVVDRLTPDIQVDVSPEDERAYFVDAYKMLQRPGGAMIGTNITSLSVTNRARRRLNEAELVRMLRDGETPEDELPGPIRDPEQAKRVITDPALARAIDLLKALAVVRHTRS